MTPKDKTRKPRGPAGRRSLLKTSGNRRRRRREIFSQISLLPITRRLPPRLSFLLQFPRVNEMSGPRFKLEVLPAGTVVGAFQMLDAVHAGALDGGHGVCAYWYGKHKAFSLFGTITAVRLGRQPSARLDSLRRRLRPLP